MAYAVVSLAMVGCYDPSLSEDAFACRRPGDCPPGTLIALDVVLEGEALGAVVSEPSGRFECAKGDRQAVSCSATLPNETELELIASADRGSAFAGWRGCAPALETRCKLTLTASSTVHATFGYALDVDVTASDPEAAGVLSWSSDGIELQSCRPEETCAPHIYARGETVTFTAALEAGSRLERWEGCAADPDQLECSLRMDTAQAVNVVLAIDLCGNGALDESEECDRALEPATCDPNCRRAGCGNGWAGGEESCDDRNRISGDGCSDRCTLEPGYRCTGTPGVCSGFIVSKDAVRTAEPDLSDMFTVRLNRRPSGDVTLRVSSDAPGEASVSPAMLTFTPEDWAVERTIAVHGQDDRLDDGDAGYGVTWTVAESADRRFDGLRPAELSGENLDDDGVGFSVRPLAIVTEEPAVAGSFTMVLTSRPSSDVVVDFVLEDPSEGTLPLREVVFTPVNWDVPAVVNVHAEDDREDDGDQTYRIISLPARSSDAAYDQLDPADVVVINRDDGDVARLIASPSAGLVTDEGGRTATFFLHLASIPAAEVIVSLVPDDAEEVRVTPGTVTFTAASWNIGQEVELVGLDDPDADGDVSFAIDLSAASADAVYDRLTGTVRGINAGDGDTSGISISPASGLVTRELNGTATFSVVLSSRPSSDVALTFASSDPSEGTVPPGPLIFTSADWSSARMVTVTGVNDEVDDGDVPYAIAISAASADPQYGSTASFDVPLSNIDDDAAGYAFSATSWMMAEGSQRSFTVFLTSRPTADVAIHFASSRPEQGNISSSSPITFTPANWSGPRTVFLQDVHEQIDDGNQTYTIITTVSSNDPIYAAVDPLDLTATSLDNDTAGVDLSPSGGFDTSEDGSREWIRVHLTSQPTAEVRIDFVSSDLTEGVVEQSPLEFDATNWSFSQNIYVRGVNDGISDGPQNYLISISVSSNDAVYDSMSLADLSFINFE